MPAERTSGDLGSRLRAARERRGLSLRDVAATTKISVHVLEALERNDIRRLPGGIFSRAFVRSYAAEVGLDADQAAREFLEQFPDEPHPPAHGTAFEDGTALENERRTVSTFLVLVAISIPVAAAVLYFATAGRHAASAVATSSAADDARLKPRAPAETEDARLTPRAPVQSDDARVRPAAAPQSEDGRGKTGAPTEAEDARLKARATTDVSDGALTIVLTVTRPCWIAATADGERVVARVLQPGEQRTITVKREVALTAGDAAAVEMTINGTSARPLGNAGEVVTARLNPSNYKGFLASR